ncbi:MAG TPA: hypothetical protein VLB44_04065 [Kofleriaceae bacterium]|nr:hypothetical protein [Kofleriaceae bacterium]
MGRDRTIASLLAIALSGTACSTFSGSRTTTIFGAGTLAVGGGVWVASRTVDSPDTEKTLKWAALGTASLGLLLVISGIIGMVSLPTEEEAALELSKILITKAHNGNCTVVRDRAPEVEAYDSGVYDRVLLTDDAVKHCLQQ